MCAVAAEKQIEMVRRNSLSLKEVELDHARPAYKSVSGAHVEHEALRCIASYRTARLQIW